MHLLDLYWLVMPNLHRGRASRPGLLDVAALLGSAVSSWRPSAGRCGARPLVPLRDPRLPESLAFENV